MRLDKIELQMIEGTVLGRGALKPMKPHKLLKPLKPFEPLKPLKLYLPKPSIWLLNPSSGHIHGSV